MKNRRPARRAHSAPAAGASPRRDVYQSVADRIVALLDAGVAPWQKPWSVGADGSGLPVNAVSRKAYRGINVWLLQTAGYADHRWLTFKQALDLGGNVRKGEKATKIVIWRETSRERENDKGETERRRSVFAAEWSVFNYQQCDGLPNAALAPAVERPAGERHLAAQAVLDGYLDGVRGPAGIVHGGNRASYSPALDVINLPQQASFDSLDGYYSTAFHEAGHSTGHASRLNRDGIGSFDHFGSGRYGKEELVAELTASYLSAISGISVTIDNSAAYLQSWIRTIKADPKIIISAAGQAQRAADLILGEAPASPAITPNEEQEDAA